ncbi:MAG: hypothetical protein H6R13_2261 [Proteobacteria bacterium]|nr:hypothetical protein [Pseudomonadota bacterium]
MYRIIALLCLGLTTATAHAEEWMVKKKLAVSFDDAKESVVMAIENRGLVINYTSHIADMLARTGSDIGATRQIFDKAEIVEFCSAKLSRKMMEVDPHNIVLCPFAISIYTLPGEKNTTWLAYRLPKGEAAKLVAPLFKEIAAEVGQ